MTSSARDVCHKRCFEGLKGMFKTRQEQLSWRRFTPEGCLGRIEGIEGPPLMDKIESLDGPSPRLDNIGGPLLHNPSCDSDDRGHIQHEGCAQKEDKPSCLLPPVIQSTYNAGSGPIQVFIVTLGGQELTINGCTDSTTIGSIKVMLQEMLSATSDELTLLLGGEIIDTIGNSREQTIHDLGLDVPGVSLAIIRRQSRETLNRLLAKALESGRDEEARDLIDSGAGFDGVGNSALFMGSSMLHLALRMRLENLALFLIKSGADIHSSNECGRRPLAIAAMKGLGRIAKELLNAGADADHQDRFGHSARYYASSLLARKHATENGSIDLLDAFGAY
jgi:hypothetical protein